MRLLPPQRLRPHYYEAVEQALQETFEAFLFRPMLAILPAEAAGEFENAPTAAQLRALRTAVRAGLVRYRDGRFFGEFDAQTTAALRGIGAVWHERAGEFLIAAERVPDWLKGEAAIAEREAAAVGQRLQQFLSQAKVRLEGGQMPLPLDEAAAAAIEAVEVGFQPAADALAISKRIPAAQRGAIERRYVEDVRPYVVKDTAVFIDELHEVVVESAAAGWRYDHLVDDIQRVHGVAQRKARFLARQETSLFMAGYRRERFAAAGVRCYRWSTSHDERVRPAGGDAERKKYGDHRALDKQEFYYDQKAPASYMSSKQPCNPGEDFGCRCVDLAVVE